MSVDIVNRLNYSCVTSPSEIGSKQVVVLPQMVQKDDRRLPLIVARAKKGLSLRQLAESLKEKGAPVSPTILCRLENSWDVETRDDVKAAICVELGLKKFPERGKPGVKEQRPSGDPVPVR